MVHISLPDHGKFHDLNVPADSLKINPENLAMLVKLGYEVIALTNCWESSKKITQDYTKMVVPSPPKKIEESSEIDKLLKRNHQTLMQFTRLTIELRKASDLIKVEKAANSRMYDILAVHPHSEELFNTSCTDLDIDLICIEGVDRLAFTPDPAAINRAISKGIYFEASYSPMIKDSSVRRVTICNVQKVMLLTKGKNLVLSSASVDHMNCRGPYDVISLNYFFGLKENSFIHTISKNCRTVLVRGFCRKSGDKEEELTEKTSKTVDRKAAETFCQVTSEKLGLKNEKDTVNDETIDSKSHKKKKKRKANLNDSIEKVSKKRTKKCQ